VSARQTFVLSTFKFGWKGKKGNLSNVLREREREREGGWGVLISW
jgi:hypothetical protein